jgi:probable HAF family extracellular repeat protein
MPRDYVKAPDREFEAQVAQFLANRGNLFRMRALLSAMVLLFVATATSWSQSLTWLGTLPGYDKSFARGVSADGRVVVGYAENAEGYFRAFRWTAAGGMEDLGTLGSDESYAYGVSADGRVVVGVDENAAGLWRAFRWTADGGMADLGTLGDDLSVALDISADGRVVVGWARNATGPERAFRWTAAGGVEDLGTLGGSYSVANGVSSDGRVVVGYAQNAYGQVRAFRWTATGGMKDLNIIYACLLTDGSVLYTAYDISPNGRYIVGDGYNAATRRKEAFLLDTGTPLRVQAKPQQQPQQKPQRKKPQHKEPQRTRQ